MPSGVQGNPEAELSPLATAWLEEQGFEVYAEVPLYERSIDLVGARWSDNAIIAVELKMTFSHSALGQAVTNQLVTPRSYIAIPTTPMRSSIAAAKSVGVGIVKLSNAARVILEAKEHIGINELLRDRLLGYCTRKLPGGTGGVISPSGRAPAQSCHEEVMLYVAKFPKATWQEISNAIPSHYAHASSFRSCMLTLERFGKVEGRIGRRALRKRGSN